MEADGLLEWGDHHLLVPEKGKPFVRNIGRPLDPRLLGREPETQIFSQTV